MISTSSKAADRCRRRKSSSAANSAGASARVTVRPFGGASRIHNIFPVTQPPSTSTHAPMITNGPASFGSRIPGRKNARLMRTTIVSGSSRPA